MASNPIPWPREPSASRPLVAGLVLLMSIMGCAHLAKSPSQTSTTGSTSSPSESAGVPKGSASREDAPALPSSTSGTSHPADGPGAGASSKSERDNAKAGSRTGGTAEATKTPSPVQRGSDKGQPRAVPKGPPTLALSDIEQRLRDTHAIGVFTKLSLKNQIDDLLDQLHAYRLKPTGASLPPLRHRYDVLLQEVIGLLQSGDPSLAKDISSSREALWSLLTDSTIISQL
jgi:hypothetical protein